jgi:hypothetical protein
MMKYTFFQLNERFAIKADPYQWMVCKRKGNRWIPKTFHTTLEDALIRVQGDLLKKMMLTQCQS